MVIALLNGGRSAAFERYLNAECTEALRAEGLGRIDLRVIDDADAFVRDSAFRQYQFFRGSPVTFAAARKQGAYRALLKTRYQGRDTYTGVIIVNRNSGIRRVEDLVGKRLLFLNSVSASGYLYPRLYLLDYGITEAMFSKPPFNPKYVHAHADLVREVDEGWADAACTHLGALDPARYPRVQVLATLPEPIPSDLLYADAAFARAHPALTARLTQAFQAWTDDADYRMVPARDTEYRPVEARWVLLRAYERAEARLAAAHPEQLRDVRAVRRLYSQVALWQAARPWLYALAAVVGLAVLGFAMRTTRPLRNLLARLRPRAKPLPGTGGHVFISHASADAAMADAVVAGLEARGVRCWIAPRDVPPGENYADALIAAIDGSGALLVLLSAAANRSAHVKREVGRAVDRRLPLLTLRLEDRRPARALEYYLADTQWLDIFTVPSADQLDTLALELTRVARLPHTSRKATP